MADASPRRPLVRALSALAACAVAIPWLAGCSVAEGRGQASWTPSSAPSSTSLQPAAPSESSLPEPGVQGELRGPLADCFEGTELDSRCMEDVFAESARDDLADLASSSAVLSESEASVCLIPARDFVQRAWADDPDGALGLLSQVDPSVCQGGFVYGALAAAGADKGDRARAAVEECGVFGNEARQWCSHGVGLTSWSLSAEPGKAAEVCVQLAEPSQRMQCSVGVVMGVYEWPADESSRPDPSSAHVDLPPLCLTWPQGAEGMAEGCGRGVGYVLFIPIAGLMDSVLGTGAKADRVDELAQVAMSGCAQVAPEAASAACAAALVEYTASRAEWDLAQLGGVLESVCAAVPPSARAQCP